MLFTSKKTNSKKNNGPKSITKRQLNVCFNWKISSK